MTRTPVKYTANVIGCTMLIQLTVITLLPSMLSQSFIAKNTTLWILFFIALMSFSTALGLMFIKKMCDFSPKVTIPKKPISDVAALVGMGMGIMLVASMANSFVVQYVEKTGGVVTVPSLNFIENGFQMTLYFLYMTAITAFCEEVLYRGCFLNLMLPYGKAFALVFSAFAFALMHRQLTNLLPTFIRGIFMGMIYLYTDSLIAPMTLHFANNAYAFLVMYMENKLNDISFASFAVMIMTVIILAFSAGYMHTKKRQIKLTEYLKEKSNAKISSVISAPVFIMAVGACVLAAWSTAYGV